MSDRLSRLLTDIQHTGTVFVSSGEASCRLHFLEQNVAATWRGSVSVGRHRRQTRAVAEDSEVENCACGGPGEYGPPSSRLVGSELLQLVEERRSRVQSDGKRLVSPITAW